MKKIIGNILAVFIMVLTGVRCSNQPVQTVDGGGTETVIGKVVFEDGGNAVGTQVEVIPVDFNPVSDGALPDFMQTVTDKDGGYRFNALPVGTYNIFAYNIESNVYLFRPQVTISKDIVLSLADTLKQPGVVKVILTDTVDIANGYVFIMGTTIYRNLSEGSVVQGGLYSLLIDNIPAATFSELQYSSTNETFELIETFTVASLDTVIIEAFDYTVVIGSVKYESGIYASGTYVTIVPSDHIPMKDESLPEFMSDTTGVNGEFIFKLTQKGNYNIQAVQPDKGVYLFHPNIMVDADTIAISPDKLTQPGTLKLIVPDTVDDASGSIVVEGTTFYTSLAQSTWLDTGFHVLYFNSLPAGKYSAVYYLPSSLNPQKAVDTMTITTGNTVQREAFVHWYHYTSYNSGLPTNKVLDMDIGPNGTKWFGTDAGVVSYDGTNWTVYSKGSTGLLSDTVMSVTINTDGAKWFGTTKGIAKYDGTDWVTFTTEDSDLPNDSVFKVVADGAGSIWIGTDNGAAKFDGVAGWDVYTTLNSDLPHPEVYCIAIDHDDVVWLGTDGGGLARKEGTNWTIYSEGNSSLPSKAIFAIHVDKNNNKLIGTFGGVAFYNNITWDFYHTGSHMNYKYVVSAIATDDDDIKWFGSYEGGRVFRYDGNRIVTYNTKTSIISSDAFEMFTIQIDADNNKWVPTSRGGVYVFGPVD